MIDKALPKFCRVFGSNRSARSVQALSAPCKRKVLDPGQKCLTVNLQILAKSVKTDDILIMCIQDV
jgi:hypothetical protein